MPFFSRYSNSSALQKLKRFNKSSIIYENGAANIFTVPAGVYSICAVAVGGGGTGAGATNGVSAGGGGGSLAYKNNISVTPGQQLIAVAGWCGNGSMCSTTNWARAAYEEGSGGHSYLGTLNVTLTGCTVAYSSSTPITTDITVSCDNTTGLSAGMFLVVADGYTGRLQNLTTVVSVTNINQFVMSDLPIRALSSAKVYAMSTLYVIGRGGGYPTGYVPGSLNTQAGYFNRFGGVGGLFISGFDGDGGGSGGNGGDSVTYTSGSTLMLNGSGAGGAGGYSGAGGWGGNSSTADFAEPSPGQNGSGGGGGGGSGGATGPVSGGYVAVRGSHGGGVGLFGQGTSGLGGNTFGLYVMDGHSGQGGSGGYPSFNQANVAINYPGATATTGTGPFTIYAPYTNNFSFPLNFVANAGGGSILNSVNRGSPAYLSITGSNNATMYNYYSQGVFNGTYPNSIIYLSGWSDSGPDKLTYGGGDGSMLSNGKGGRGGIRIVWGFDRSFPSTNVSTV